MKKVRVRLFGALKKFVPSGEMELPMEGPLDVAGLKRLFAQEAKKQGVEIDHMLLAESALATKSEVLLDGLIREDEEELSLLPPVCGG